MPLRKVRGVIVEASGWLVRVEMRSTGVGWESGLAMKLEVYEHGVKMVMQ